MSYQAEIVLKVGLLSPSGSDPNNKYPPSTALSHITMLQDDRHKRWHEHGRRDPRLPGTGPLWLRFERSSSKPGNMVLLNKHGHEWCELENFPETPNMNSMGTAYFSNLNYPQCKYTYNKKWFGDWLVNRHVRQANIQAFDPSEGKISQLLHACGRDTGFRYDTSSSFGFAGGAGAGAGATHMKIVLMRKEPQDKRRWDLSISAAGVGVMTPGAGATGSAEASPSAALSDVMASADMRMPVHPNDFKGTVLFWDSGGGVAAGKGVHVGLGGSLTTFMFIGGVNSSRWYLPDISTIKATFQTISSSGAGSRTTGMLSGGAQSMVYGGICTSVTERKG